MAADAQAEKEEMPEEQEQDSLRVEGLGLCVLGFRCLGLGFSVQGLGWTIFWVAVERALLELHN